MTTTNSNNKNISDNESTNLSSDAINVPTQPTRHVEVAIIGAGTAGQSAYKRVREETDSLVIINEGYWTTTCATVGCMPSKLLVAAAERAHHATHSEEFGIGTHQKSDIDGKKVMARIQRERDRFAGYASDSVDSWDEDTKISGTAKFTKEGFIAVNDELIDAKHVIIANGTKTFVPPAWEKNLGDALLTSDTIFEMPDLPKSMAVVGGGAIGLEMAQSFSRLGVEVTLFNQSERVGSVADDAVNQKAIDCFSQVLTLKLGSDVNNTGKLSDDELAGMHNNDSIDTDPSDKAFLDYTDKDGNDYRWVGEKVLVAIGRRHTLAKLGIENLDIDLDVKGIPMHVNHQTGQIGTSNIFIAGDASGYQPFMHVANYVGKNAGKVNKAVVCRENAIDCNALINCKDNIDKNTGIDLGDITEINAHVTPSKNPDSIPEFMKLTRLAIIFSDPQMATVGPDLTDLQEKWGEDNVIAGEVSFDNQGRSRIMGMNCGLLRIYARKTDGVILGACMVAPDAEYIAHILATAVTHKLSADGLLDSPFYHPTILEGLRTGLIRTLKQVEK